MARPNKETVDYYPHFVKSGRTIFILESKYGNDGYAFWFKLLEILGEADGHWLDCSVPTNWAYLLAKTRCDEEEAKDIIGTLLTLGKIDSELWNNRQVIWCQNFVNNLFGLYKMRHTELPTRPEFSSEKPDGAEVFFGETPEGCELIREETPRGNYPLVKESKVKESKVKESKVKESKGKESIYPYRDIVALWNEICFSLPKVKVINDNRKAKIKYRLQEFGKPEEWTDTVRELFQKVQASDFLRGNNNHQWAATFDWLFENDTNWVKVQEGNYDNNRGTQGRTTAANGLSLGVGEFIDAQGRRTYGTGAANIPYDAPARPSERHAWNASTKQWVIL